jgi:hypothetical protein
MEKYFFRKSLSINAIFSLCMVMSSAGYSSAFAQGFLGGYGVARDMERQLEDKALQDARRERQYAREKADRFIQRTAAAINADVPKLVRPGLQIDGATVSQGLLTFHYTVLDARKEDINPSSFADEYRQRTCTGGTLEALQSGYVIARSFRDGTGVPAFNLVYPRDCR